MTSYEVVEPRAESLVESLRAFGYATETAVADLVDNSITAKAATVDVRLRWAGNESWIAIADDGLGMDGERLREAMRPGTSSPLTPRTASDLRAVRAPDSRLRRSRSVDGWSSCR